MYCKNHENDGREMKILFHSTGFDLEFFLSNLRHEWKEHVLVRSAMTSPFLCNYIDI